MRRRATELSSPVRRAQLRISLAASLPSKRLGPEAVLLLSPRAPRQSGKLRWDSVYYAGERRSCQHHEQWRNWTRRAWRQHAIPFSASAVNATITNNGGEVSGAGGGVTSFTQTATAADARITCNGGFGGGDGGESWGQS